MVSDELSGDHERSELSFHPTLQGQTLEAGGSDGPSGGTLDASVTAPVGLGLAGLQPLPARVSEYMVLVIDIKVTGFTSLSNVPPHLCTSIFWDFFTLMVEGDSY